MAGRDAHRVGSTDEVAEDGSRLITEVDGIEIAVFRVDGGYYAVANHCVHQGGPLCEGDLRGDTAPADDGWEWGYDDAEKYITCPWHAWKFDVTTGRDSRSGRYSVPTFEVEVRDGDLYVRQ